MTNYQRIIDSKNIEMYIQVLQSPNKKGQNGAIRDDRIQIVEALKVLIEEGHLEELIQANIIPVLIELLKEDDDISYSVITVLTDIAEKGKADLVWDSGICNIYYILLKWTIFWDSKHNLVLILCKECRREKEIIKKTILYLRSGKKEAVEKALQVLQFLIDNGYAEQSIDFGILPSLLDLFKTTWGNDQFAISNVIIDLACNGYADEAIDGLLGIAETDKGAIHGSTLYYLGNLLIVSKNRNKKCCVA